MMMIIYILVFFCLLTYGDGSNLPATTSKSANVDLRPSILRKSNRKPAAQKAAQKRNISKHENVERKKGDAQKSQEVSFIVYGVLAFLFLWSTTWCSTTSGPIPSPNAF